MTYDHGPLLTYEVTWASGHVERVQGHQCIAPQRPDPLGIGSALGVKAGPAPAPRWMIHGEIDGRWRLLLAAHDEDIRTIREVTRDEVIA